MHGVDPYLAERSMHYRVQEIESETKQDRLAELADSRQVSWISEQSHKLLRMTGRRLASVGSWLVQMGTLSEPPSIREAGRR